MSKMQVEVITSVQRRRRWAISEKEQIVAAALEPESILDELDVVRPRVLASRHLVKFSPASSEILSEPGQQMKRRAIKKPAAAAAVARPEASSRRSTA
jgi:hypothetical protein